MLKKKDGFTLVEILGVIVILGLLFLLAFPAVVNQIKSSTGDIDKATKELIFSSTRQYLDKKENMYPIINGNVFCISLKTLVNNGDLIDNLTDIKTGKKIDLNKIVMVSVENIANIDYSIVNVDMCDEKIRALVYNDNSGAPVPVLDEGMIPIKWDGTNWVKANIRKKWYDYDEKEWANAVLVKEASRNTYKSAPEGTLIVEGDVVAYLVWIPRYRYRLFNVDVSTVTARTIEIVFEYMNVTKSTGSTNGSWLTHPAFTFGSDELDGFWVGKFETTGIAGAPTVKPGVASLRSQNISTQFTTAQNFNNSAAYGVTSDFNAHMMKNSEWGAVAYLTQSIYGKNSEVWINPSSSYITGCAGTTYDVEYSPGCGYYYSSSNGVQASTTGNVYGIYDMNGGADEYVMGAMYNSDNTTIMLASTGFGQAIIDGTGMEKYINKYKYSSSAAADISRIHLGDATGETKGWYGDSAQFLALSSAWFSRGGYYSSSGNGGIFSFGSNVGAAYSYNAFRLVISS